MYGPGMMQKTRKESKEKKKTKIKREKGDNKQLYLNFLLNLALRRLGVNSGKVRYDLVDTLAARPAHKPRQFSHQAIGYRLSLAMGTRTRASADLIG